MDQLFNPFFTTKGEEGTGLGLWVSKGILDKHEALIEVRSKSAIGDRVQAILSCERNRIACELRSPDWIVKTSGSCLTAKNLHGSLRGSTTDLVGRECFYSLLPLASAGSIWKLTKAR